jgi:hypothetical protein
MRLLMLVTLAAVLWTGQLPIKATLLVLGLLWGPATLLSIAAGSALCRGYQRISDTTHFELCTAEIFGRALRCVLRPGRTTFKVTPKEGVDLGGPQAIRQLPTVTLIAGLLLSGVILRILDDAGVHLFFSSLHGIALWFVPLAGVVELRRVLRTLTIVATRKQQRIEYRMPLAAAAIAAPATPGAMPLIGRTRDLSPSGLGLQLPRPVAVGTPITGTIQPPTLAGSDESVSVELVVQSCHQHGETWTIGSRIVGVDDVAKRRIIEYCYVINQAERLSPSRPAVALPTPVAVPERIIPVQAEDSGELRRQSA